jgi:DNA-binding transcriptional regulator YiaG
MPKDTEKLRTRIKELRKDKALTQTELARWWGKSLVTVQTWEKKSSIMYKVIQWVLLAQLLGCSERDLVTSGNYSGHRHKNIFDESECLDEVAPFPKYRISFLRQRTSLTQESMACAVEVSSNTVQNWENGRSSTNQIVSMLKLCDILECRPVDLVKIPDEELERIKKLAKEIFKDKNNSIELKDPDKVSADTELNEKVDKKSNSLEHIRTSMSDTEEASTDE